VRIASAAWSGGEARAWAKGAAEAFYAERDRWPLWLPVLFGAGILVYFGLPLEPSPYVGAVAMAIALALAVLARGRQLALLICIAVAAFAAGFAAVQLRAALVAGPTVTGHLGPVAVEGRIVSIDALASGNRVTLDRVKIARLAQAETPKRVRIRAMTGADTLHPGQRISLRAELNPPPWPAAPGSYDFARRSWFEGVGAVGFSLAPPRVLATGSDVAFELSIALERLRHDMTRRIQAGAPGDVGAINAALMTGEQGAISEHTMQVMRDSGLAHLLSISGVHFALVAGLLFFAIRFGFALWPSLALRYPIKKWAAVAAMFGAFGYLLISGASVPAERSFFMIALVLLAVLIDRSALSMRLIAWAAALVLLLEPESLTGPSFQMSFGAVIALIATYETMNRRFAEWRRDSGPARRVAIYVGAMLLTTTVATLATAPYSVFHFNRVALYGLAANLVAIPLTSVWIMPWALVAFALMPFGLESWALTAMGWGTEAVIRVADTVAGWGGAVVLIPAMPRAALAALTFGLLWLCLWRRRWRLAGLGFIVAGLALMPFARPPDLLIDDAGKAVGLRGADGALALTTTRAAKFDTGIWLRRNAQAEPAPLEGLECDALSCIWRAHGQVVALVKRPEALAEDCARATVIVSVVPVPRGCRGPLAVIDKWSLWRAGSHAVWLDPDGVRVESARAAAGDRPWVRQPEKAARERRQRLASSGG
jgi:competence protein ComEC